MNNQKFQAGDKVRYEDMANQNGPVWTVLFYEESTVGSPSNPWSFTFGEWVMVDERTGEKNTSDFRQRGWTKVS